MPDQEYLVSYGNSGDFSRFRVITPHTYQRGDRVIVRSHQGLEIGVVMCPASPDHALYLSDRTRGELLRPLNEEDQKTEEVFCEHSRRLFEDAQRLVRELELPLEILDVEVLFDGKQAVIQHVRQEDCDYRPLVSGLSKKYDMLLIMQNLALPAEVQEEEHGCGKPDCGRIAGGGCTTCSSGGGCSTGSCGAGVKKEAVTAFLAGLREKMENRIRTPLL